jgi:hypothetical protein
MDCPENSPKRNKEKRLYQIKLTKIGELNFCTQVINLSVEWPRLLLRIRIKTNLTSAFEETSGCIEKLAALYVEISHNKKAYTTRSKRSRCNQ